MQTMQPGHGSRILTDSDNLLITHSDILKYLEGDGCVVLNKKRRGLRHTFVDFPRKVLLIFFHNFQTSTVMLGERARCLL